MSLDDPTPTEYFGPHAKRWTNPDTGVTLSLSPRDYDRAVLRAKARALEPEYHDVEGQMEQAEADGTPQPKPLASASDWPNVISMDTMHDRDLQPEAGLFKEKGVLVTGEVDYDFAERLSGGTLRQPEDVPDPAQLHWFGEDSAQTYPPVSHTLPAPARLAHVTLTDADDTIGRIQLMTDRQAGEAPAARHLRRRRISRNAARLVLVYIIAVIGVAAVAGVL